MVIHSATSAPGTATSKRPGQPEQEHGRGHERRAEREAGVATQREQAHARRPARAREVVGVARALGVEGGHAQARHHHGGEREREAWGDRGQPDEHRADEDPQRHQPRQRVAVGERGRRWAAPATRRRCRPARARRPSHSPSRWPRSGTAAAPGPRPGSSRPARGRWPRPRVRGDRGLRSPVHLRLSYPVGRDGSHLARTPIARIGGDRPRRAARRAASAPSARARRGGGEVLAAITVPVAPATDPSAVVFASRRDGEPWFCFEQPDRDGAALAALGCVRAIRVRRRPALRATPPPTWRELAGRAEADAPDGPAGAGLVARRRLRLRARRRRRAATGRASRRRPGRARGGARAPRRRRAAHARRAGGARRRARGDRRAARGARRRAARGAAAAARPGAGRALPDRLRRSARALRGARSRAPSSGSAPATSRRSCSPARSPSTRPPRTTPPRCSACCGRPSGPVTCSASAAATPPSWPPRPSCWSAARACAPRPSRSPARPAARPTRRSTTTSASSCCARDKDREEQAIVTRRIARALRPHAVWVAAPDEPAIIKVANIQHLATPIRAQLTHPRSAIELAGLLHPTPAVGGEPHAVADAADPRVRGPRPRLVRRPGRLDRRQRGRRVLRRPAVRAAARARGAPVRRRGRGARLRPGGRAGRDRGQARRAAARCCRAEPRAPRSDLAHDLVERLAVRARSTHSSAVRRSGSRPRRIAERQHGGDLVVVVEAQQRG